MRPLVWWPYTAVENGLPGLALWLAGRGNDTTIRKVTGGVAGWIVACFEAMLLLVESMLVVTFVEDITNRIGLLLFAPDCSPIVTGCQNLSSFQTASALTAFRQVVTCTVLTKPLCSLQTFVLFLMKVYLFLLYVGLRYSMAYRMSLVKFMSRLGIFNLHFSVWSSPFLLYSVLSHLLLWSYSNLGEYQLLSVRNAIDERVGGVVLGRILQVVGVAPFYEELLFRCILFLLFYNRLRSVFYSTIMSNLIFGLVHLLNLAMGKYSMVYAMLQCMVGMAMGLLFTLTYLETQSVWASTWLHSIHNMSALFLHSKEVSSEPFLLCMSGVSFCIVCIIDWKMLVNLRTRERAGEFTLNTD